MKAGNRPSNSNVNVSEPLRPCFAETVADSKQRLRWLHSSFACNVVAFDYRGYGKSTGTPTLLGCAKDALLIYDALMQDDDIKGSAIWVYGRSLGGGMATYLAAQRPVSGLCLEAAPAALVDVVKGWETHALGWPARWFISLKPDPNLTHAAIQPITLIQSVFCPLLIIHGERDTIIPYSQGQKLYAQSPSTEKLLLTLPDADHNSIVIQTAPIDVALANFHRLLLETIPEK
jgi:fermentation-respiration switch protein FrsA (DUF1100 family)